MFLCFLFFTLHPFVCAHPYPTGRFTGTKEQRNAAVQKKKHSLPGTAEAICNHNSSYLLIFYLKHSDVNSIVPCQPPWGKVHFETKTNFLRAGKSDLRLGDNGTASHCPGFMYQMHTPCSLTCFLRKVEQLCSYTPLGANG